MNPQPTLQPPSGDSPRAVVVRSAQGKDVGEGQQIKPSSLLKAEKALRRPASASLYRPTLPVYTMRGGEMLSPFFFTDVEVMRLHPSVSLPLTYCMGPMHYAEWVVTANSRAVAIFAAKMLQWLWNNAYPAIQAEAYTYGWAATEWTYTEKKGVLVFDDALTYNPRDSVPLVDPDCTRRKVGMRVNSIGNSDAAVNLWGFRKYLPNKGFWYVHRPRFGLNYGQSQIRGAWKYWRRLAGVNGVEEIEDLATYRHGVGVTVVRHPNSQERAESSALPQYAVNGVVHDRDIARFLAQNMQSASSVALSSENWPQQSGGGPKWDVDVKSYTCQIGQIGEHDDRLTRRSSAAIGVPSELYEAAQTGSGYSGRAIPLQGFLVGEQTNLTTATKQVNKQAIEPLARYNYGRRAWVDISPKPLTETVRKSSWDSPGDPESMVPPNPMSQGVSLPGQGEDFPAGDGQPDAGQSTPAPAVQMSGNRTVLMAIENGRITYRHPSLMSTNELQQAVKALEGLTNG